MGRLVRRIGWRGGLVYLLAFAVYLPGFQWGTPYATAGNRARAWSVDDEPPLGPLAQMDDILHPKAEQNPNLGYPMLHPFLVVGAFAPYMGWLLASGQLASPSAEFPYGFADPVTALRNLSRIAHLLSVLLAAGVVLAAWETSRTLWDERTALWSAALVGSSYPLVYYARTSNVDVPVLFFTALALIPFARALMLGVTRGRAVALGVVAGLALATKEPAFASFLGIPVALLLLPAPGESTAAWRGAASWRDAAFCLAAVVAAYAVASGMVIDPRRWSAHIAFIRERSGEGTVGLVAFMPHYPVTWEGHTRLATRLAGYLVDAMTLPGLALGTLGVVWSARRRQRAAWLSVTCITYMLVLFWAARAAQLRYVMPAALTLGIFGGFAVRELLRATERWRRLSGWALATTALALAGLWAVDLTYAMFRDSRYDAARWLRQVARPGDRVEYFGSDQKQPPMEATVESGRAVRYLGGNVPAPIDSATVAEIRAGWAERRPRFITLQPDYTSRPGEPFAASCPPRIYDDLMAGVLGYRLVARFETPALLPWARRPPLDYPTVNPPILFFERVEPAGPAAT